MLHFYGQDGKSFPYTFVWESSGKKPQPLTDSSVDGEKNAQNQLTDWLFGCLQGGVLDSVVIFSHEIAFDER